MNVDQTYDRLYRVRHSAAHVLATAMLDLFPRRPDGDRPADRRRLLLRL